MHENRRQQALPIGVALQRAENVAAFRALLERKNRRQNYDNEHGWVDVFIVASIP
jgi:hypothetical protein